MLYTRNKDCFKKTVKVDHIQAKRNIINLVKDICNKSDASQNSRVIQSHQSSQNQCKNIQKKEQQSKLAIKNLARELKVATFCQSIYSEPQKYKKNKQSILTIQHVIDYSIKSCENNNSKSNKAHKQYVGLLQTRLQELQKQIKRLNQQLINNQKQTKNKDQNTDLNFQRQLLERFYHRARNILVIQSVELLECKNIFVNQLKSSDGKIKSINSTVSKTQQLLQVYKRSIQKGSPFKLKYQPQQMNIQQLKDLCSYQQKTIDFLRKQKESSNQFNEIRLLRHQINRVCNQNQSLLEKISKIQSMKACIDQTPNPLASQQSQKIKLLQSKLQKQTKNLHEAQNKSFKYKQQKQMLQQLFEQAKTRIISLQQDLQKYEKEIKDLKVHNISKIHFSNNNIATTEQLCRQLKAYPRYFNLLMSIINQYQNKVCQLQEKICVEREHKQKFIQWSSQVYRLLQQAQLPQQILQKHMNDLYKMDHKINCSKIQKYLRQIRSFSIGIDDKQIKQMQAQLQQYIITLKSRNQVIKQVDCEDGSSVAVSDTFTDQQFQQVQIQRKWEMHNV